MSPTMKIVYSCVKKGDTATLDIMLSAGELKKCHLTYACARSAVHGNDTIMMWAMMHGATWDGYNVVSAASYGHVCILEYASKAKLAFCGDPATEAAKHGHFEVLEWLYKHGHRLDKSLYTIAAECDNMRLVRWLLTKGVPFDTTPVFQAYLCKKALPVVH